MLDFKIVRELCINHNQFMSFCLCTDTCDSKWQSTRNVLIIVTHTVSDVAFVTLLVATGIMLISKKKISCKYKSNVYKHCLTNAFTGECLLKGKV